MIERESIASDWSALKSVYNSAFFCSFGFFVVSFLIPIIAYGYMSASATEVALVFSMFALGSAVFSPIAGKISKRRRRRSTILLGAVVRAVSYIGMALSIIVGSKYLLTASSLLWGIGAAFYRVGSDAEISERVLQENRAEAFGRREAANGRGSVLGAIIGFTIIFAYPEYGMIVVLGFFALSNLVGGLIVIVDRRPLETVKGRSLSKNIRDAFGIGIVTLIIAAGIDTFISALLSPFVELFILDRFTGNVMEVALVYLPGGILSGLFGGAMGHLADNRSKVIIVALAVVVGALSTLALVFIPLILIWPLNMISIAVLFSIGSVTGIMSYTVMSSVFGTAYEGRAGEGFGLFEATMGISRFSAPLIGGVLWDLLNPSAPFVLVGISGFILVPIYVHGMRKYERAVRERNEKNDNVL